MEQGYYYGNWNRYGNNNRVVEIGWLGLRNWIGLACSIRL